MRRIADIPVHLLEARPPAVWQGRVVSPPGSQLRAALLHREYKRARLDQYRDGIRVLPSKEQLLLRDWTQGLAFNYRRGPRG